MKLQTLKPRLQIQRASSKNNWGSGRGGRPWRRLKAKIHLRDKYTCQCCGVVQRYGASEEVQKMVNLANEGPTISRANIAHACGTCLLKLA